MEKQKYNINIFSIQTLYSVLSTFGSNYSLESSWVFCTPGFGDSSLHILSSSVRLDGVGGRLSRFLIGFKPVQPKGLWTRFSLRISLYIAPFSFPSTTPPQHDAATTILHCWNGIGQVMSSAWFPPDMTLRNWGQTVLVSSENHVSHSLRVLLQTPSRLSCAF